MSRTPRGEAEHVADRAVHLRRAAQAVGVLHRVPAVPVAGHQRRPASSARRLAALSSWPGWGRSACTRSS